MVYRSDKEKNYWLCNLFNNMKSPQKDDWLDVYILLSKMKLSKPHLTVRGLVFM